MKRKRDTKSPSKKNKVLGLDLAKKFVQGLDLTKKSVQGLDLTKKSVQDLEKAETNDQQTHFVDVNQILHKSLVLINRLKSLVQIKTRCK